MMRKTILRMSLGIALLWSVTSMADNVGVIDMKTIFSSSEQVKKINEDLKKQFSSKRDKAMKANAELQDSVQKLERNKSVMNEKSTAELQEKIQKQAKELQTSQMSFQQELMAAQNKAMQEFMNKLNGTVAKIAKEQNLDVVIPKDATLYSTDKMDITARVQKELK